MAANDDIGIDHDRSSSSAHLHHGSRLGGRPQNERRRAAYHWRQRARSPGLPRLRPWQLTETLGECAALLAGENGLEEILKKIKSALPSRLRETAYALACDVAAADSEASQEELRVLELIRDRLKIDRLIAAAIERGTRARFTTAS